MKSHHFVLAVLVNIAWGCNVVAVKFGLQELTPIFFTFIRFVILALLLMPWLKVAPGQMKQIVAIAFTAGILHFTTFFTSIHLADNVASVAILLQLSVPFSAILAIVFLKESISLLRGAGMFLAFIGAMFVGFEPEVFSALDAALLTAFAAFSYAVSAVIARTLKDVNALQIQAWLAVLSTPCLLALSFIFEGNQFASLENLHMNTYLALAYTILAASILGHGGMYHLLKYYPVTLITPFILLGPIVGVAVSVLLLDDTLGWKMIVGGFLTLIGIALINNPENKP